MTTGATEIQELLAQWRRLMAASRPHWRAVDLTFTQLRALSVLSRRQPLRMSDLADELQISLASASALVDRMARNGLVSRHSDPDDRRTVLVDLSSRGRHLIERLERGSAEHFGRLIEQMTSEERAALATALRAFVRLSARSAPREASRC